jgi:phospholipase/carboxylesterase
MAEELLFLERTPREESELMPLMVMLHGRANYAKTIFTIEGLLDPRFTVLAIQAPFVSDKSGFEWFKPNEAGRSDEISDASRFQESEDRLTLQIERMRTERGLQNSPLYLLGFSQGAAMCFLLGLRGKLGARRVVPMSGFLPQPVKGWERLDPKAKYMITHGTEDEVLPPEVSIRAKDYLVSRGIDAQYHEYRGRHKMSLSCLHHVNAWLKQDLENLVGVQPNSDIQ